MYHRELLPKLYESFCCSGGPSSRPAQAHDKVVTKKKKLLRRKSAGSSDCSMQVNEFVTKKKIPALGKRGSLRSSSFGGVGCSSSVILQKPLRYGNIRNRLVTNLRLVKANEFKHKSRIFL